MNQTLQYQNKVGLINQAPTILKPSGLMNQIPTTLFWDELVAIAKNARFSLIKYLSKFYLYPLSYF